MSIAESIAAAISGGRLLVLDLEFDSDQAVRSVLLHPQLAADMKEQAEEWGRRVGQIQGDLESFVKGEHMSLSMMPRKHKTATMGLMSPATDGIWEFRCRVPRPGLRVFGKFPCTDKFVALNWEPRSIGIGRRRPLGHGRSLEFELALIEANERWDYALPDVTPLTGGNYRDYVSENSSQTGNRR